MNKFISSIGLVCLLFGVANAQIISKDGVAKDTVTGLEWQDDTDVATVTKDWDGANQYCHNLKLAGYRDWQLPNIYELSTLFDNSKYTNPYIIDGFQNLATNDHWSFTTSTRNDEFAWISSYVDGQQYTGFKSMEKNLRCKRGKQLNFDDLVVLKKQNKIKANEKNINTIDPKDNASKNAEILKSVEIELEKQLEEQRAYHSASEKFTVEAFKSYLSKYPNGKHAEEANKNIEEIVYDDALSQNTIKSLNNYIVLYPNGMYSIKVSKKINELAYNTASSQNTIPSYKAYLKQFPNGEYASSARSNIQYLESEAQFRALLQSKSPQTMYIEAGKQERNGNTSKANKLYEAIIDRFPNSDFAVKASDKLTGAIRTERAESNRRSQSRQECENNKNACFAGCGTYISGADSHNNAVWSCNDKCKQISCY